MPWGHGPHCLAGPGKAASLHLTPWPERRISEHEGGRAGLSILGAGAGLPAWGGPGVARSPEPTPLPTGGVEHQALMSRSFWER